MPTAAPIKPATASKQAGPMSPAGSEGPAPSGSIAKPVNAPAPAAKQPAGGSTSTPARGGGDAFAAVLNNPNVARITSAINTGLTNSRFPIVHSRLTRAVSWANPLLTAGLFLAFNSSALLYRIFSHSIASLLSQMAVLLIVASGALAVAKVYNPSLSIQVPSIPLASDSIRSLFTRGGDACVRTVEYMNRVLTWSNPTESLHALAYAWLALRLSYFMTPVWATLFVLASFVVVPVYALQQRIIDQEYTLRVLPIARTVKDKFGALSGAVRQQMATNAAAVQMGGAAAALLVTYTFWNYISFPFLFTVTSLITTIVDFS